MSSVGISTSYYRARYYDSGSARFAGEDPFRYLAKSPNFYAYVHNNPVRFKDPLGLYTLQVGLTLSGTLPIGPVGITLFVSSSIAIDTNGGVAIVNTYTPFPGVAEGGGLFGGVSVAASNAATVCGLGGPFAQASASGGDGLAGTVDYFTGAGDGPNGIVDGGGVTFGLGGGGSASVAATQTGVHRFGKPCPCTH